MDQTREDVALLEWIKTRVTFNPALPPGYHAVLVDRMVKEDRRLRGKAPRFTKIRRLK